jgi:hypothetical protein
VAFSSADPKFFRTASMGRRFGDPANIETFILVTGRRDPRIYAIDFNAALKSRNPFPNAIDGGDAQYERKQGTTNHPFHVIPYRDSDWAL